jgi:alpha-galactosidase
MALEYSTAGRGDFGFPSLILERPEGMVFDFAFADFWIGPPKAESPFPIPHGAKEELILEGIDKAMKARLRLHYLLYEKENVVGRYVEIVNEGATALTIRKAASFQLALPNRDFALGALYGSWANEGNLLFKPLRPGRFVNESLMGASSSRHNPFCCLLEKEGGLFHGSAYGFNLVYSGSHEETAELDAFGRVRIQGGVSSLLFDKTLGQGERFFTPVAVLSFSDAGENGLRRQMASFAEDCVIPEPWKGKERPIAFNNWEATMFSFDERKIRKLMCEAASLGMELFVLDDGWFGSRSDDSRGLGDWEPNPKKLPGGLKGLASYAQKLGLRFGIWMEPEMVNEDSDLFRKHPDWIIAEMAHKPLKGRHQFVLDLTKKEVRDFVYGAAAGVLRSADISYLKWDFNRPMSDFPRSEGTFVYDYCVGLYEILGRLTRDFPQVLFENCASGGNRFDLGMLSYFPQSWMSDDTDSFERILIQGGSSIGYPLSAMSNHVAAKTSNQLLRVTSLDAKFDVAAFGVLGYELDLGDLSPLDEKIIKKQISFYKAHRRLFQFGEFAILRKFGSGNREWWQVGTDEEAVIGQFEKLQEPAPEEGRLIGHGFEDAALYAFASRPETISLRKFGHLINLMSPIHIREEGHLQAFLANHKGLDSETATGLVSGAALNSVGAPLPQEWLGTGLAPGTRVVGDFGGRLYHLAKR